MAIPATWDLFLLYTMAKSHVLTTSEVMWVILVHEFDRHIFYWLFMDSKQLLYLPISCSWSTDGEVDRERKGRGWTYRLD